MNLDFCICDKTNTPPLTNLDVIFRVWGTAAYKVPKKKIAPNKYYFVITTRGSGTICYDDSSITIYQDQSLLLQPSTSFSYGSNSDIWEFWWFEFFIVPMPLPLGQLIPTKINTFQISLLEHCLRYAKEGHWNIAESLFMSQYEILALTEIRRTTPAHSLLLDSIEQYIAANFQVLQVNDLCEFFQITNRSLYNLFHARHNCSPKQYMDMIRLENGKQLLLNSTLSIASVSEQLGYANQFHFSKRFQQHFGISPLKFRNISH